ncbi:MAG: hypothetical protein WA948_00900 [Pontixanthobacter sp.]
MPTAALKGRGAAIALTVLTMCGSASAQAPEQLELEATFERAAKCRVYAELLSQLVNDSPERETYAETVYRYRVERSNIAAKRLRYTPETMEIELLTIPVTADLSILDGCIEEYRASRAKARKR